MSVPFSGHVGFYKKAGVGCEGLPLIAIPVCPFVFVSPPPTTRDLQASWCLAR